MVDVFSRAEDLLCVIEDYDLEEQLKDLLRSGAEELLDARKVEYSWVSDNHIFLEEEDEDLESDLVDYLDTIYSRFIDDIIDSDEGED